MTNYPVLAALVKVWSRLGLGVGPWAPLMDVVSLVVTTACGVVTYRILEKPLLEWFQRRFARAAPAPTAQATSGVDVACSAS